MLGVRGGIDTVFVSLVLSHAHACTSILAKIGMVTRLSAVHDPEYLTLRNQHNHQT